MSEGAADYEEVLLEHNRRPRNRRDLPEATHHGEARNPLCGDEVSVALRIGKEGIEDVTFRSQSCAVCTASASMLTLAIRGLKGAEAVRTIGLVREALSTGAHAEVLEGDLGALAGVRRYPVRIACAVLPWHAAAQALAEFGKEGGDGR
jgi:nitrogen fixation NifU-like protein